MASFLISAMLLAQPPGAADPPASIRIVPRDRGCDPASSSDEIVVCGRRDEDSPYRIPREFRDRVSTDDAHASWDLRIRDQEAIERFSNQTDGPFGVYRHSREVDCQWRIARQELRGERPDCGRGKPF
jgi:hypothetical protein